MKKERHAMTPVADVSDLDDDENVQVVEHVWPRPCPVQWPMAEVLGEMGPARKSNRCHGASAR